MARHRGRENRAGDQAHADFLCRMVRNYTKKVRQGDLVDAEPLRQLARVERELEEQKALIVHELKARGLSWQEIGDGLGMTRSAAYTKYVARACPVFPSENAETVTGTAAG
jgi:hypothetical protein